MTHETVAADLERLNSILADIGRAAVAVSGGVDSLTLAYVANRVSKAPVIMYHAVSPAVPPDATQRVKAYANDHGWQLKIINAGEFEDSRYVSNPANRCYYCKTNLYRSISALESAIELGKKQSSVLLSGANLDDKNDWRPGLKAAAQHSVRHPFIEAQLNKEAIRGIARSLHLDDIAKLPASPCLSSRIETGIPINARELQLIHAAETVVKERLSPETVRCRVRAIGIVIELDTISYDELDDGVKCYLIDKITQISERYKVSNVNSVTFMPYVMGSAFLR